MKMGSGTNCCSTYGLFLENEMNNWQLSEIVCPSSLISICDVGASYLDAPRYDTLLKSGLAKLIGFEPNLDECQRLKDIYGPPHAFYPNFVGNGGDETFYETNWFPTGSLLRPNVKILKQFSGLFERATPVAEHPVTTIALDNLLGGQSIDYLKIDVQGGELAVFEGAVQLLQNTLVIETEVEFVQIYENQPLFSDVDQFLRGLGFGLVKLLGPRSCTLSPCVLGGDLNNGNQLVWADVLYMRNIFELDALPNDQLIKFATLAHDIYAMSDFTYRFLAELDRRQGSDVGAQYLRRFAS
jgi:protein O-GlcNAc transferase